MPLSLPPLPPLTVTAGHLRLSALPTSMSRLAGWLQEQMLPSLQRVPTIGIRPPLMLIMLRFRPSRMRQRVHSLMRTVPLPSNFSMVLTGRAHPALLSTFQPRTGGQPTTVITLLTALSLLLLLSMPRLAWITPSLSYPKLQFWTKIAAKVFRSLLLPAGRSSVVAQTLPSVMSSPLISHLPAPGTVREATPLPSFSATTLK